MNYDNLPITCDLCMMTMTEAALRIDIPPAKAVYELHVSKQNEPWAKEILRTLGAQVQHNPLAPYVNLIIEPDFQPFEWCLSLGDRAVGSRGL